jgi:hypothetical protein
MTGAGPPPTAPFLVLRLAALAWLALAAWQVARVTQLEGIGLLRSDGAQRLALLALLPLAAAWGGVLVLSRRGPTRRLQGGVLAQGLSAGAMMLLVLLLSSHWLGMTRAGGSPLGTLELMLGSLLPQALALAAAAWGARALRPRSLPRAKVLLAWGVSAAASFALNTMALAASSKCSYTETRAIGDLRTLLYAERAYQGVNAGHFGPLRCLVSPSRCLPAYPADGPAFLDAGLQRPVRCGYRFALHPGAPVAGSGSEGFESFAVTAVPVVPGVTGFRAFCADSDGAIREAGDGRLPLLAGAACPAGMAPLP